MVSIVWKQFATLYPQSGSRLSHCIYSLIAGYHIVSIVQRQIVTQYGGANCYIVSMVQWAGCYIISIEQGANCYFVSMVQRQIVTQYPQSESRLSHCIHCPCSSLTVSFGIQFKTKTQGLVPPTFRLDLPTSTGSFLNLGFQESNSEPHACQERALLLTMREGCLQL